MYNQIVVGIDGSQRALDAVRTAAELAELIGLTEIHVVTACRTYSPHEMARIHTELPEEFHDLVSPHLDAIDRFNAATAAIGPNISMIRHEMHADPADSILTVAHDVDADLVVVGARGMGAIERFLRGSVSTKVAHHAPCDVLVVEHHD